MCCQHMHAFKDIIHVKAKEISQRRTASNPDNIDIFCWGQCIHCHIKCIVVNTFHGHFDLFNVRMQDPVKYFYLRHITVGHLHPLYGIQFVAHQLFQCTVKFRVSFKSQLRCETHGCRFADTGFLSELCCCQKYSFVVMLKNIWSQPFLPFTECFVLGLNPYQQIVFCVHVSSAIVAFV